VETPDGSYSLAVDSADEDTIYGVMSDPATGYYAEYQIVLTETGVLDYTLYYGTSRQLVTTDSGTYRRIFGEPLTAYETAISNSGQATAPPPPPFDESGISVIYNGRRLYFDVPPQIMNGRTMVPLRTIFEAMGAEIEWDGATQTVTATSGNTVVILTVGSTSPTVNGDIVIIDQPGLIVDGRTLAPLRFVAEAFGGTVEWDGNTQTATIHAF
jgi:hypothetical protein